MKVEMDWEQSACRITKEPGDKRVYRESLLYYAIKKELIKQGFDCVKKPGWKDGHLIDVMQYIIRDRKRKWILFDQYYAIRQLFEEYNKGKTELHIVIAQGTGRESK